MSNEPKADQGIDPELLAAYIDQRLPPEQRAVVEANLATDPDAYAIVVDTLKALDDETLKALELPDFDPAPTLVPPVPKRRVGRQLMIASTVLAAAAAIVLVVRVQPDWLQRLTGGGARPQLASLVAAVGQERYVSARLSGGFEFGPLRSVTRGGEPSTTKNLSLAAAAGELERTAGSHPTAANLHGLGVAQVLLGQADAAVSTLEAAAALGDTRADLLSDLAGAYIARAGAQGRSDDWPRALTYADRAIAGDPGLLEARFNRALALEALDRRADAIAAWNDYVARDPRSAWADEARRAIARLQAQGLAQPRRPGLGAYGSSS